MNRFCVGKVLPKLPLPSARNLDPTRTAFSEFFVRKIAIDVSVTSSCVQKMTQITETKKKPNPISFRLLRKRTFKKCCLQWRMRCL